MFIVVHTNNFCLHLIYVWSFNSFKFVDFYLCGGLFIFEIFIHYRLVLKLFAFMYLIILYWDRLWCVIQSSWKTQLRSILWSKYYRISSIGHLTHIFFKICCTECTQDYRFDRPHISTSRSLLFSDVPFVSHFDYCK